MRSYHNVDFRKVHRDLACTLTICCQSSGERRTQLSAWEGTQSLRRERHAHRWPSMVRGAMLARPTRRAWGYCDSSRERGTQLSAWERELNHSEGSGMLIGDPLWWGEQCWLDQPGARRAWGYCDSSRERGTQLSAWERELNRSEGSGMLISDPLWWGEQC